jgi:hypothetical protein
MNRSILAGAALLLGAAVAAPVVAWSADNPPQAGQAAPAAPAARGDGTARGPGMMGQDMMGQGMMGQSMMERGGWRHGMMMRRWARLTPRQHCIDRMAHRAGMIAYTLTKLNLTPQQRQSWDKVEAVLRAAGEGQRHLCETLPASAEAWRQQTILDRLQRREESMSAHLHDLQQIRPILEQFYRTLTPAQQAILNHPFRPS